MKTLVLILLGTLSLIGLLIWFAVGGTKIILTGNHGPFAIGDSKAVVAETLRDLQVWPPYPIASHKTSLNSPSIEELNEVFRDDEGLNIWFGVPAGNPMRLEFRGDTLVTTWPKFKPKTWSNPNPGYDEIDDAMLLFQSLVSVGMDRQDVFLAIANNNTGMSVYVNARVAGQRGRVTQAHTKTKEYSEFVMNKDAWKFKGLHEAVWYSFFIRPFYSQVSLYFDEDELSRIEHFHGPAEMP